MAGMNERGQALLIGAIFLAAIILSLAFVLNSAVYGITLSSESIEDVSGYELVSITDSLREDAELTIRRARTARSGFDNQQSYATSLVSELTDDYERQQASQDRVVDVSQGDAAAHVYQDANGDFRSAGGSANWDVVRDADIRNLTIVVDDRTSLSQPPPTSAVFGLFVGGTEFRVYDTGSGSIMVLNVDTGDSCSTTTTNDVRIEVVEGQFAGSDCVAFDGVTVTDTTVRFENGDTIQGRYYVLARDDPVVPNDPPNERLQALYLDLEMQTTSVDYDGRLRVTADDLE